MTLEGAQRPNIENQGDKALFRYFPINTIFRKLLVVIIHLHHLLAKEKPKPQQNILATDLLISL